MSTEFGRWLLLIFPGVILLAQLFRAFKKQRLAKVEEIVLFFSSIGGFFTFFCTILKILNQESVFNQLSLLVGWDGISLMAVGFLLTAYYFFKSLVNLFGFSLEEMESKEPDKHLEQVVDSLLEQGVSQEIAAKALKVSPEVVKTYQDGKIKNQGKDLP